VTARRGRPLGTGRFTNPQTKAEILRLRQEELWSLDRIAAHIGCSESWVRILTRDVTTFRGKVQPPAGCVEKFLAGASIEAVAEACGYLPSVMRRMLLADGVDLAGSHDWLVPQIVRRYTKGGESIREIAAAMGLRYYDVRRWLVACEVPLRSRGGDHTSDVLAGRL
jgi:hypothetical protein